MVRVEPVQRLHRRIERAVAVLRQREGERQELDELLRRIARLAGVVQPAQRGVAPVQAQDRLQPVDLEHALADQRLRSGEVPPLGSHDADKVHGIRMPGKIAQDRLAHRLRFGQGALSMKQHCLPIARFGRGGSAQRGFGVGFVSALPWRNPAQSCERESLY